MQNGITAYPDPLKPAENPELVFALVGPLGVNLQVIIDALSDELKKMNYTCIEIRLSSLLRNLNAFKTLAVSPEDTRIEQHMKAGTDLRRILKRSDALALLAIASIKERRTKISANKHNTPEHLSSFLQVHHLLLYQEFHAAVFRKNLL